MGLKRGSKKKVEVQVGKCNHLRIKVKSNETAVLQVMTGDIFTFRKPVAF